MIYVDINDIRPEFRKALYATNQNLNDWNIMDSLDNFEIKNNCKVVGSLDAGGYHCTDGLEFPDEKALMFFKLKWA